MAMITFAENKDLSGRQHYEKEDSAGMDMYKGPTVQSSAHTIYKSLESKVLAIQNVLETINRERL